MFYEADNPIMQIVGVEHLHWGSGTFQVTPRKFAALGFRIAGSAVICSGGKEHKANASDILYLPQNMCYTAQYTDTEMIAIHFITAQDDEQIEVYSMKNSEQIYKMFLRLLSIWKNKEPGYAVYAMAQLYTILGTLSEKKARTVMPEHFLKAISFINSHYKDSSLSVDRICAETGIGATRFRQLFRIHYQKTPVEYITALRLEHARNLISGGASIETAAYESGFNDPKYFARVVKKHFGCMPRQLKTYGK